MSDLVFAFVAVFVAGGLAGASLLAAVIARRPSWRVDRAPLPMTRETDRATAETPALEAAPR